MDNQRIRKPYALTIVLSLTLIVMTACLGSKYQQIKGWVFLDVNHNGMRDAGDTPLQGVEVRFSIQKIKKYLTNYPHPR